MIDILEAIKTKYDATVAMQTGLTGGFHLNHPGPGHPRPFAVAVPIGGPPEHNTGGTYSQDVTIQIAFFANQLADILAIKKQWIASIHRQPLTLAVGRLIGAELADERPIYEPQDTDAFSVWHYVLEFTFTQLQTPT